MRRTEVLEGLRMMKFRSVLDRWESAELSQLEAAELLGIGERTFRRWCGRYREGGEAGLLDGRLGQAAGNRVPAGEAARVEALCRERYAGFTARHFHECLVRAHAFGWGYTWTKVFLQRRGLLKPAPRRGAHRRKRPRRPLPGMMLHQDASRHDARSFAPRGETPVIPRPAARYTQSMISSVTNRGTLRFMIYDGALNAATFMKFLRRLIKGTDRKLFVIVDNLRVHRAKTVT